MDEKKSLREVLQEALADKWTKELEDQLFWPISYFCNQACNNVRDQALQQIRESLGVK